MDSIDHGLFKGALFLSDYILLLSIGNLIAVSSIEAVKHHFKVPFK